MVACAIVIGIETFLTLFMGATLLLVLKQATIDSGRLAHHQRVISELFADPRIAPIVLDAIDRTNNTGESPGP